VLNAEAILNSSRFVPITSEAVNRRDCSQFVDTPSRKSAEVVELRPKIVTKFEPPLPLPFLPNTIHDSNMDAVLGKIPNVVIKFFASVGFIFFASRLTSFIQLLLSLFVLSGKNVC
jgi:hypothetical protein